MVSGTRSIFFIYSPAGEVLFFRCDSPPITHIHAGTIHIGCGRWMGPSRVVWDFFTTQIEENYYFLIVGFHKKIKERVMCMMPARIAVMCWLGRQRLRPTAKEWLHNKRFLPFFTSHYYQLPGRWSGTHEEWIICCCRRNHRLFVGINQNDPVRG